MASEIKLKISIAEIEEFTKLVKWREKLLRATGEL